MSGVTAGGYGSVTDISGSLVVVMAVSVTMTCQGVTGGGYGSVSHPDMSGVTAGGYGSHPDMSGGHCWWLC